MPIINISVKDKIATAECGATIVCKNSDYVVRFDFDSQWDDYIVKTAKFAFNETFIPIVFTGSECAVPKLPNTYLCGIEVEAGNIRTSVPAWIDCLPVLDDTYGEIEPPTPSVYEQLMQMIKDGVLTGAKIVETRYIGVDEKGGNVYKQIFDNGTENYFTAPKGLDANFVIGEDEGTAYDGAKGAKNARDIIAILEELVKVYGAIAKNSENILENEGQTKASLQKKLDKSNRIANSNLIAYNSENQSIVDSGVSAKDITNNKYGIENNKKTLNLHSIAISTNSTDILKIQANLNLNTAKINQNSNDIYDLDLELEKLTKRFNALANSDDITLDQLAEIVEYIKSNKSLIDAITTAKVNVVDIVDNLISTDSNKPLSANQGRIIKGLIDILSGEFNTHQTTYNAKVAELEAADKANNDAIEGTNEFLAKHIKSYEAKTVELQESDKSNATAIKQVDKELKQLIKGLYEIIPPTLINEFILEESIGLIPLTLIEGWTYIVVCDGVEYTCVPKTLTFNEQTILYLGNLYKLKEALLEDEELPFEIEDTGEPFLFYDGVSVLVDKNKEATLSVYAYLHNVGEILPETSIDRRIVNFTSPTLLKEGDAVYATIDGKPYMVQMEVQDINNGGDDGWTEEDGLCIPDGTYLVAEFNPFADLYHMRLAVNGTNCYFQDDYYLNDLKPRTVEIFKCEKGDGTIPEVYLPKPDDALDPTSERPVQNKVVAKAIGDISVDAVGGLIPRRDENGNINAPNQITHSPSDDQYISTRYFKKVADERYLKIVENTWGMKAVYAQHPKSVSNAQPQIGATEEAIGGALAVRTKNGNITAPDQTDYDFAPKPREFISREYLESVVPYSESIILPAGTSISMPLRKVCGFITLVGNGETVVEITQVVETSGLVTKTVKASKLHQLNITRDPNRKEYSFWISSVRDGTLGIPNVEYMIKNVNEDSLLTIRVTTDSNMTLLYQPVRANLSSTSYIYSIEVVS